MHKTPTRLTAAAAAALLLAAMLGGCSADEGEAAPTAYPDEKIGFQLEAPPAGEEIAVMHTSEGDIRIRFFPEAAPKAVQNFKELAKQGYYDGLKLVARALKQSRDLMMEEISDRLAAALKVY